MKTTTTKLFILFFLITLGASAQVQYQTTVDITGDDYTNELWIYNNTCVSIGSTSASGGNGYNLLIVESDMNGTPTMNFNAGGTGTEFGTSLYIAGNGERTYVGRSNSYSTTPANVLDVFVARIEANGTPVFVKVLGSDSVDYGMKVREANDGGVIIAGLVKNNTYTDGLVIKMSATGTVEWSKSVGTPNADELFYDIVAFGPTQGYLALGYSRVGTIGGTEAVLNSLTDNGVLQATLLLGGAMDDDARLLIPGQSGKVFIAGNTRSFGAGLGEVFVARLDGTSFPPTLDWFKTYGGSGDDGFTGATPTPAGGLVISGLSSTFGSGGDAIAFEIDADGVVQWAKNYGGSGNDVFQNITSDGNGGYIAIGYSNSFGGVQNDVWIVNMNSAGESGCNESTAALVAGTSAATFITPPAVPTSDFAATDLTVTERVANINPGQNVVASTTLCTTVSVDDKEMNGITVYPNPAGETLNFNFGADVAGAKGIIIYNSTGAKVFESTLTINKTVYTLDISRFENGFYTAVVLMNDKQLVSKITVAR